MPRFRLTVEYDGTPFVGWQRQDNGPSVQQAIEDALYRFCGERATVHGAGRTDAGVHALAQVAHVDLARGAEPRTLAAALNFHLRPHPVAIVDAAVAADDFHARFSARERAYRYRLLDRPAPAAIDRGRVWWMPRALDPAPMLQAAERLVGRHDFTSFRSTQCGVDDPVKTLAQLEVRRVGEELWVEARARSFLHNQVRIITGTLVQVGLGRWTPADVSAALNACDRCSAGPTAPACGLYLVGVRY